MPGSWEIPGPQVHVGILTREIVTHYWAEGLRQLWLPPNSTVGYYAAMPYDMARNTAVKNTLDGNFQWLFFLDDDTVAPSNALQVLMSVGHPIVSGLYHRRSTPVGLPVALIETPQGKGHIDVAASTKETPIVMVDYVGAGCLLIHRSVLETLTKLYRKPFEWTIDQDLPEGEKMSEDYTWCKRARGAGYKILLDSRVVCKHIGVAQVSSTKGYEAL